MIKPNFKEVLDHYKDLTFKMKRNSDREKLAAILHDVYEAGIKRGLKLVEKNSEL